MASCVTKQQWAEVYNKEKTRLYEMEKDGYDIEDAMSELEAMDKRQQAGDIEGAKKIAQENAKKFTNLTGSAIAKVRGQKPMTAKGTKLEIVGGYKDENDNVTYKVKYPNNSKVYNLSDSAVYLDQEDSRYGVIFGNEPDSGVSAVTKYHEQLKEDIWNDQGNALKLFDQLAAVDGDMDSEHTAELRKLLTDITDPTKNILNKFKVYLNDEANKNGGVAIPYGKDPKIIINYSTSNTTNEGMSAAEVYVHEMIHMSIEVAKEFKKGDVASTLADLHRVHEIASQKVTVEDLIENGDRARAERMWNYMFANEENGLSEFMAYAMTNKKLKDKLKEIPAKKIRDDIPLKTIWDWATWGIIKLFRVLEDVKNWKSDHDKMDERVGKLVTELWEHNNQTIEKAKVASGIRKFAGKAQDKVDNKLREAAKGLSKFAGAGLDYAIDKTDGMMIGVIPKGIKTLVMIFDPWASEDEIVRLAETFRRFELGLGKFGGSLFAQEGSLAKISNYIKRDDSEIERIERMSHIAQKIDSMRETTIATAGGDILEKLGAPDHKDQTAITKALIEVDVQSIREDYSMSEIKEFIGNDSAIDAEITKLVGELEGIESNKKYVNYYKAQAKGLGIYMATGKGSSALNLNASDIAGLEYTIHWRNPNKNGFAKVKPKIAKIIDKIATLEGIKNTDADARNRTEQLMKDRPEGVQSLLEYHSLQEAMDIEYRSEHGVKATRIKGAIKDLTAPYVQSAVAPSNEAGQKRMKKEGFKYVGPSNVTGIGVYKKMVSGMDKFSKGTVAKINEAKATHNIVGVVNKHHSTNNDLTKGLKKVQSIMRQAERDVEKQMETGELTDADGYVAVVDETLNVSNYEISIDKNMYADAMLQDRKAPVLMGKMIAEVKEKTLARIQNNKVFEMIEKDMQLNYKKRGETGAVNRREYIEIGPDAKFGKDDDVAREFSERLMKDMPDNLKRRIRDSKEGSRYIAIRRDQAVQLFGRRAPSILNGKIRALSDKDLKTALRDNGLQGLVEAIRIAGDIWSEVVSMIKIDIVIKTPKVIKDNVISNFNYSWALGQMPWETGIGQLKMFKATKEYLDTTKKLEKLELVVRGGNRTRENLAQIKRWRGSLKDNPVHPLMEAGLFTAVLEDLRLKDLQTDTRIGAAVNKITQKVPTIIRNVAATAYITQDTQMFGAMMQATTYSDFVARANRYYFLIAQGHSPKEALKMVTDEFTNYDRDLGGGLEWIKDLGISQFHQYLFGSTKNMAAKVEHKPSSMLLMNFMLDAPNPSDAMIYKRDLSVNLHGWDIMTEQAPKHIPVASLGEVLGVY